MKSPRTVLITGASGGIGAALARQYAQTGRTLILHGRDQSRLDSLARTCEADGAVVRCVTFDLRDARTAQTALDELSTQHIIDLAIINAGVSGDSGAAQEAENWEIAHTVLAVNLDGALASIAGVLPAMRRRGAGQIAVMSSLSAYIGLPRTPSYCAGKAALKIYAEALRAWLAPQGVAVNVLMPGFVDTQMTTRFRGPRPGLLTPERAAVLIRRGLERNRARVTFPRALAWGMWWLSVLPPALSQRILRAAGYGL